MKITHSDHIMTRIELRGLDKDLPENIYRNSDEHYTDTITGHDIAVLNTELYGRQRDVMVAYTTAGEDVKLLTIHPLKAGQKENRVSSGRWRRK